MVQIVGMVASIVSVVIWFPQAVTTWRMRHDEEAMRGLSRTTMVLVVLNALLWFWYGLAAHAIWTGIPGLVNLPLACTMLWVSRPRRAQP